MDNVEEPLVTLSAFRRDTMNHCSAYWPTTQNGPFQQSVGRRLVRKRGQQRFVRIGVQMRGLIMSAIDVQQSWTYTEISLSIYQGVKP